MRHADEWKREAIERDMIASAKKLGKGKNTIIVKIYKLNSLGEDKRLKIEIRADIYDVLSAFGINFDDFSKGEKMFEKDRNKFMEIIEMMGCKADIVDKDFTYKLLFGKKKFD